MGDHEIISEIKSKFPQFNALSCFMGHGDELIINVKGDIFKDTCLTLHNMLPSPVMMLFALDERKTQDKFTVNCVFVSFRMSRWITVSIDVAKDDQFFDSLAKNIYSATLFEREIWEMFGIQPKGNPDLRRLNLHDEVMPSGNYPLRKDFQGIQPGNLGEYKFAKVEGEGIFEVPVGPVHAGIIGPGHFRFSIAGEPIINLETRFGFTHRGIEKLFEGKTADEALKLSECVTGDSIFAHSLAFTCGIEKIFEVSIPKQAVYLRGIYLELERLYNHVNDIGGIALDVGFSFPSAYASIIKEGILQLNKELTGHRYLKGVNLVGGVSADINEDKRLVLIESIKKFRYDLGELVKMLNSSVSFMDRVDSTGVLRRKTAEDFGVVGLVGRASGIPTDLRKYFPGIYKEAKFRMSTQEAGDVLARLRVRISEFEESCRLIEEFSSKLINGEKTFSGYNFKEGCALGYTEGFRGPVLYWIKVNSSGGIERCKIVDPSFHNWQGLTYAVLGNIIPDFPLCNKSFNLSYPGNDL